jgi:hypothetical protein
MTVNTQKLVRVLAAPTGPTGTMEGVRIFANVTGPSGLFAKWGQINPQQMATGMTGPTGGRYQTVWAVGATAYAQAPTGTFKTVCIPGYTGPA